MSEHVYRLVCIVGTVETMTHAPYPTVSSAATDGDDWLGQMEHDHPDSDAPTYYVVEDENGDEVYRSGIGQDWPSD